MSIWQDVAEKRVVLVMVLASSKFRGLPMLEGCPSACLRHRRYGPNSLITECSLSVAWISGARAHDDSHIEFEG